MVHNLYSVRDRVAEEFGPVFQAVNDGIARRAVVQMLQKVAPHDRDAFVLFKLGTYDSATGLVVSEARVEIAVDIPNFDEVKARKFAFEDDSEESNG